MQAPDGWSRIESNLLKSIRKEIILYTVYSYDELYNYTFVHSFQELSAYKSLCLSAFDFWRNRLITAACAMRIYNLYNRWQYKCIVRCDWMTDGAGNLRNAYEFISQECGRLQSVAVHPDKYGLIIVVYLYRTKRCYPNTTSKRCYES